MSWGWFVERTSLMKWHFSGDLHGVTEWSRWVSGGRIVAVSCLAKPIKDQQGGSWVESEVNKGVRYGQRRTQKLEPVGSWGLDREVGSWCKNFFFFLKQYSNQIKDTFLLIALFLYVSVSVLVKDQSTRQGCKNIVYITFWKSVPLF